MPINFGSPLTSAGANDTFLDKTIDDIKTGKLSLQKSGSDPNSIDDIQVFTNDLADTIGTFEGDTDAKDYSSTEVIADNDSHKTAIEKLDAQVGANTNAINALDFIFAANEAIAASGSVSKDDSSLYQVRRVSGDGLAVTLAATPFGDSSATSDGIRIVLRGTDSTNTVTVENNDIQYGAILNGSIALKKFDQLELMYDATEERWLEQRRMIFA